MEIKDSLKIKGHAKFTIRDAKTGRIKRVYEYDNLNPTIGRLMIADNLTNASPDNVMRVNYFAVGSNATAVNASDVALGTETFRNLVASETNSSNVCFFTGFIAATEDTGTYNEAGLFSNGSGAADSGILFSHVNISITKSDTETLTVDWTITIS